MKFLAPYIAGYQKPCYWLCWINKSLLLRGRISTTWEVKTVMHNFLHPKMNSEYQALMICYLFQVSENTYKWQFNVMIHWLWAVLGPIPTASVQFWPSTVTSWHIQREKSLKVSGSRLSSIYVYLGQFLQIVVLTNQFNTNVVLDSLFRYRCWQNYTFYCPQINF